MLRHFTLPQILVLLPVILICMTVHEMSHGYCAYFLGDKTAKHMNRLSPNPLQHIDWIGLLLLVTVGFGWAKPVPVNMNNFKDPKKGMAITALAGPLSNIIMAFLGTLIYAILLVHIPEIASNSYVNAFFILFLQYNCVFAMFNFIPISPLDGSKILFAFLPNQTYYKLMQYERYGMIILIILLYTDIITPILSTGVSNLMNAIINIINLLPI